MDHFMMEAIKLARENLNGNNGGPFGAVVVRKGKIIASGVNTVTADHDPTAHAEVNAIRKACEVLNSYQLTDCEIYSSCEPCPMCLGAIYWARPSRLIYGASRADASEAGFDDSIIYEEIALEPAVRRLPTSQHPLPEAIEVFKLWKDSENKIEY